MSWESAPFLVWGGLREAGRKVTASQQKDTTLWAKIKASFKLFFARDGIVFSDSDLDVLINRAYDASLETRKARATAVVESTMVARPAELGPVEIEPTTLAEIEKYPITEVPLSDISLLGDVLNFKRRAIRKIRDGQGNISDYADYFKNTVISKDEARARGLLARAKGQAGWALGKDASNDLYALYKKPTGGTLRDTRRTH